MSFLSPNQQCQSTALTPASGLALSFFIYCWTPDLPSVLWHCWLGVRKSIWPARKWVMRCWHGYLSGQRCKWFACGPADVTATPSSLASRLLQPFRCRLTQVILEKRPLNACLSTVRLLVEGTAPYMYTIIPTWVPLQQHLGLIIICCSVVFVTALTSSLCFLVFSDVLVIIDLTLLMLSCYYQSSFPEQVNNKSSAVAEMGDHGHNSVGCHSSA